MHEMSICSNLLQILEQEARVQGFHHIHRIRVQVGALAILDIHALLFCFNAIKDKTIASNSVLEVIEQPAFGYCLECFQEVEIKKRASPCPQCGAYQLQVNQADTLKICELEVT